jgi:hypothetical protein
LGFSTKRVMRLSLSVTMMPKPGTALRSTGIVPIVRSAPRLDVLADHLAVIHAVELVAAQDDEILAAVLEKIAHVLSTASAVP